MLLRFGVLTWLRHDRKAGQTVHGGKSLFRVLEQALPGSSPRHLRLGIPARHVPTNAGRAGVHSPQ